MVNYRVVIKNRGTYQHCIQTPREAARVREEAQRYYPHYQITIESYYLPVPAIKENNHA